MRRATDVMVSLAAGILLLPLAAIVAAVILVSLGRPVLFRQDRPGLGGDLFTLVKFRTMQPAFGDEDDDDDERTPTAGRLVRACSLDELPQLWNILRGDMSLIGPRPTLPRHVDLYSERQRGRLTVRPGLTGWAQVNGRNSISWPQRIELDLWYIDNRSFALDLKILALTAVRVLGRNGVMGEDGVNPDFPDSGIAGSSTDRPVSIPSRRESREADSRLDLHIQNAPRQEPSRSDLSERPL